MLPAQPIVSLLIHLAATPMLAAQLRTLHGLALYDSGDALLGPQEKEALQATEQLARLLEGVPSEDFTRMLPAIA